MSVKLKKRRKQKLPELTDEERGIIKRAAKKVAKSITAREKNELKRSVLRNSADFAMSFELSVEFMLINCNEYEAE